MTQSAFDIAILGAGPTGRVLALLMARVAPNPARIALLQGPAVAPVIPAAAVPATDPRVLALNHGSRVLLESLQAWPKSAANIENIHVSQRGRLGRSVIQNTDFDVPQLGSVVAYSDLYAALEERVAQSGVTVLSGPAARVSAQDGQGLDLQQGDVCLRARIAVQSDGASANDLHRDYAQHALITSARATLPRRGWAWERFTQAGPLALLPHPQAADAYSVVWCNTPEHAAQLASLDDRTFSEALTQAFGTRLGRLESQGPRHVFPLALKARHQLVQGRLVAIGNAAQTLHPVAGQGLNLGLRDAGRLAQSLGPWLQRTDDAPGMLLEAFAQARRADRRVTMGLTDILPRIFSTKLAPVDHACGLALLALDLIPAWRSPLAKHLLTGLRR